MDAGLCHHGVFEDGAVQRFPNVCAALPLGELGRNDRPVLPAPASAKFDPLPRNNYEEELHLFIDFESIC